MKDTFLELIALLFVARDPLTKADLSKIVASDITQDIADINEIWTRDNFPLQITQRGDAYILTTRASYQEIIDKLYRGPAKERLSGAALEVLAIVLHKGPLARSSIDQLRGVDCLPIIQSLLDKELIESKNCPEKRIPLYTPTEKFLMQIQSEGASSSLATSSPTPEKASGIEP